MELGYATWTGMSSEFQQILETSRPRVARLCRDLDFDKLLLFGSATKETFDPAAANTRID